MYIYIYIYILCMYVYINMQRYILIYYARLSESVKGKYDMFDVVLWGLQGALWRGRVACMKFMNMETFFYPPGN